MVGMAAFWASMTLCLLYSRPAPAGLLASPKRLSLAKFMPNNVRVNRMAGLLEGERECSRGCRKCRSMCLLSVAKYSFPIICYSWHITYILLSFMW